MSSFFCSRCVRIVCFCVVSVKMPKDGIEYKKSSLSSIGVGNVVKNCHIESSSEVRVLKDDKRARYPPKDMVAVYIDYFRVGLRVLVCELVPRVLEYYGVHITQLTPNAIGKIIRFEILCRAEERDPSIEVFRYFFQMKQ